MRRFAMSKIGDPEQDTPADEPLGLIAKALRNIRFGAIQLTVHDGRVTQVDVTERRRFGS
jgi:hypothetical protein